jgi:hypothetical protein
MADDNQEYNLLDDDDPHFAVVGLVACLWGLLETSIDGMIAQLAFTDERSMACVTAQLIGPAKRMDALIALFRHRGGSKELVPELKSFQGSIQQLGEDRNRIIHDPLVRHKATGAVYKSLITAKGELKYGFLPVPIENMQKTVREIRAAIGRFIDLRTKINAEMDAKVQAILASIPGALDDQNPPGGSA